MNLRGKVRFPQTSLTAGTTYYLYVGTAPANQRIALEAYGIYGAAASAQTPGVLQFCTAASAGTTPTVLTPHPLEPECTETFQSVWGYNPTGSAPSTIVPFDDRSVNPQLGLTEYFPQGQEIFIKGGGFLVIQFIPGYTGNYNGWIQINE
jgi:hypothetical protein